MELEELENQPFLTLVEKANAELNKRDNESAKKYIDLATKRVRQEKKQEDLFRLYTLKFKYLLNKAQYTEAKRLSISQKSKTLNKNQLSVVELNLFTVEHRLGAREQGYKYLVKAKELIGDNITSLIGIEYLNALAQYQVLNLEYVAAFETYSLALQIYKLLEEEPSREIMHHLSGLFQKVSAHSLALEIDITNRDKAREKNYIKDEIFSMYSISNCYLYMEEYDKSIETCFETIKRSQETNMTIAIGFAYATLARNLVKKSQLEEAEKYAKEGLRISQKQNEAKETADCHFVLGLIYLHKKEYKNALHHSLAAEASRNYFDIELVELVCTAYGKLNEKTNYVKYLETISEYYRDHNKESGFYAMITKLLEDKFVNESDEMKESLKAENQKQMIILGAGSGLLTVGILIYFLLRLKNLNAELASLNKNLAKRNEDLKQFAYITSHDLKEPIRNVKSFIGLVAHKLKKNDSLYQETKEFIHYISNSASTLSKIVETLRVYTSLSNGETTREKVDIRGVVHDLECNIHEVYKDKRPKIRIINKSRSNDMLFNREMLHLLLSNLMRNAVVHNDKDHPEIQLTIQEQSNAYIFQVSDNGPGIESAYFGKIFEPFKTLKNKSLTHSSGLGLSICKNILDRYGERIWVESTPSVGTTFSFTVTKQAYTDVQQAKQAAYTTAMLN